MSGVVRAVCVTRSVALRRALRRSLHAAGAAVEFVDDVGGVGADATLVVIDGPTHAALAAPARAALASGRAMIVVGVSLGDDGAVDGLRADGCNHVITGDDEPDDAELVVTSGKLASGDIFGLEKYLAWGVRVSDLEIASYEEKRAALIAVTASARDAGARRPMVARVESVVDELLMNAMYDAPAAAARPARRWPRCAGAEARCAVSPRWRGRTRAASGRRRRRRGRPGADRTAR